MDTYHYGPDEIELATLEQEKIDAEIDLWLSEQMEIEEWLVDVDESWYEEDL